MRDEEKLESILAMIDHIYQSDLNFSHLLPMREGRLLNLSRSGKGLQKLKLFFGGEGLIESKPACLLLVLFFYCGRV